MKRKSMLRTVIGWLLFALVVGIGPFAAVSRADLKEVKKSGVLRHIGIPYANFVTTLNSGLSVELVQNFATWLGVEYKYVPSGWKTVIGDLTGKLVKAKGSKVDILGTTQIKGDLIGNGLTVLDWRRQVVDYSRQATFPTQVWVVARVDSTLHPIVPTGQTEDDIKAVKKLLKGFTILHKANTCLDASLYGLTDICQECIHFSGSLNDLAPAVINGDAVATLLDVPDALVALNKWPGKIKIIGPVSSQQRMGVGFAKESSQLRLAFDKFFAAFQAQGDYQRLVRKYYPAVYDFYPNFFESTPIAIGDK